MMKATKHAPPALGEVSMEHLRLGHRAIALAVQHEMFDWMAGENLHDASHNSQIDGLGGHPQHAHSAISGVCELEALHAECRMPGCDCPCHRSTD